MRISDELLRIARLLIAEDLDVIDDSNAYKQVTKVRRIPIARNVDPRTKKRTLIIGNDEIKRLGLVLPGKGYLSDSQMKKLFSSEVVIEEKVDGHPVVIVYGGYTFYCESLIIKHTVEFDGIPLSQEGWPDSTVVYEVMDGEFLNPAKASGKWLSRSEKVSVCGMVGAPVVPLIFKGKIKPENLPKIADRISGFGSGQAEGVVVKNLKDGVFGKFINIEFQKSISDDALHGGKHPMQKGERNVRRRFNVPDYSE